VQEDFEERYGSTDDFSKRAVGSLFDDDNDKDAADDADGISEPYMPVNTSGTRLGTDPDKQYAQYLKTAEANLHRERERKQAVKEKAIRNREEQLAEFSEAAKRRKPKPAAGTRPQSGGSSINFRNVAAIAFILLLVVLVILVWQLNATRSRLAAANEQNDALELQMADFNNLRIANEGQAHRITELEEENARLLAQDTDTTDPGENGTDGGAEGGETAQTPSTGSGTGTGVPSTVTDAAGNRLYTVRQGDTFWSIAVAFFGNGNRYRDILSANGLTDPGGLQAGTTIIIPSN